MASTPQVEVSVGLQKNLGAGIFGGAGVVFQKLSGNGTAWVQLAGEIVEYELQPGQSLLIHPGHLALYRAEMELEFATMKGIKNKFFGDSLFLAQIHGPGHVWLQSMTTAKLAAAIEPYLPDKTSGSNGDLTPAVHESQIGPKAGMPRRSSSPTMRAVTRRFEMQMTASASEVTYASYVSASTSGLPCSSVFQIIACGWAAITSSTSPSPYVARGLRVTHTSREPWVSVSR